MTPPDETTGKTMTEKIPQVVDLESLPERFPTHRHDSSFWESLGRTIATFGFLEEILGKAIFSFTATKSYDDEFERDAAFEAWLPRLEKALTDPLGSLIYQYGKAVREHPEATTDNLDYFLDALCKASKIRNVLCHGSWRAPDTGGASIPFFVNRRKMVFNTAIDCEFLDQTQRHVSELSCAVMNSVTRMGWKFPGSAGPSMPICDS